MILNKRMNNWHARRVFFYAHYASTQAQDLDGMQCLNACVLDDSDVFQY